MQARAEAKEIKAPTPEIAADQPFAIPKDIQTALINRIKKSIGLVEKERTVLHEKISKQIPQQTNFILQFQEFALELQKKLIDTCIAKRGNPEDFETFNTQYQHALKELIDNFPERNKDWIKSIVAVLSKKLLLEKPIFADEKETPESIKTKELEGKTNAEIKALIATKTKELNDQFQLASAKYVATYKALVITEKNMYRKLSSWSSESETVDAERKKFDTKKHELIEKNNDLANELNNKINTLITLKELFETKKLIQLSMKNHADFNAYLTNETQIRETDDAGYTVLHYCCAFDNFALAKKILEQYSSLKNTKNEKNNCLPFHLLLTRQATSSTTIFLDLLQPTKDELFTVYNERTSLGLAALSNNIDAMKWLVSTVDIKDDEALEACQSIFSAAVEYGRSKITECFIPKMEEAGWRLKEFQPALMSAYLYQHLNVIDLFFDYGYALNKESKAKLASYYDGLTGLETLTTCIKTDFAKYNELSKHWQKDTARENALIKEITKLSRSTQESSSTFSFLTSFFSPKAKPVSSSSPTAISVSSPIAIPTAISLASGSLDSTEDMKPERTFSPSVPLSISVSSSLRSPRMFNL